MTDYTYQGHELDLFRHAVNWKQYYASEIGRYISGEVLEVGAGIGGTARFLSTPACRTWTCLEPDSNLATRLQQALDEQPLPVPSSVIGGTVASLPAGQLFDSILYIDVLEHIEHDRQELTDTAAHLRPGGFVVVLSPAHNWLFSPFDQAVGHFRRYSKATLVAAAPAELRLVRAFYLDSVGMLASATNRMFLKARYPTLSQIQFWDRNLVRASRLLDPLMGRQLGKTVIGVWTR